jgi:hypothetical protein
VDSSDNTRVPNSKSRDCYRICQLSKIIVLRPILGWHNFNVNDELQKRKGLRWIPRQPETRKGVASDKMFRGVGNKHRFGDS